MEIFNYDYLHEISKDNIFRWANFVTYSHIQNTQIKKIIIEDTEVIYKTHAKFSYSIEDNHEEIIKVLPRSAECLSIHIYDEDTIPTIINNPPISMYTSVNIFDKVIKGLIHKWGIKTILKSIKNSLDSPVYNYTGQVFFTRLNFYLYRQKCEKIYQIILTNIYDKDLTSILLLYIDTEN